MHLNFKNIVAKQRCGSISHLGIVDPDPRIHISVIVDPDPRIKIWKKWIRIRVPIDIDDICYRNSCRTNYNTFFLLPPKFRKSISQITKTFSFTFYST